MARREWRCESCLATLGYITTDRFGRDHLKAIDPQVTDVKHITTGLIYSVKCACGASRQFHGWAIHFEPRDCAA